MLETKIIEFLEELSEVQEATLDILQRKTKLLATADTKSIAALAPEEQTSVERLQKCLEKRAELLELAKNERLPCDSIESLARHLDTINPELFLEEMCFESKNRTKIMRLQSLTNWVLVQRTTSHFTQILELISAKGRPSATYERKKNGGVFTSGGALVDLGG